MHESNMKIEDFTYSFEMFSASFIIRKSEYKPEVFGILKTFSWQICTDIFSILIALSVVYYIGLKKKYTLNKIFLHTCAVLLRHSSILKPSSMAENFLVYSWVVGAMFLCLAYDSVFLCFLAFSQINPIKDIFQLSKAILNRDYHCIIPSKSVFNYLFENPKQEI